MVRESFFISFLESIVFSPSLFFSGNLYIVPKENSTVLKSYEHSDVLNQ